MLKLKNMTLFINTNTRFFDNISGSMHDVIDTRVMSSNIIKQHIIDVMNLMRVMPSLASISSCC